MSSLPRIPRSTRDPSGSGPGPCRVCREYRGQLAMRVGVDPAHVGIAAYTAVNSSSESGWLAVVLPEPAMLLASSAGSAPAAA